VSISQGQPKQKGRKVMNNPLDRLPTDSVPAHVKDLIRTLLDHAETGAWTDAELNHAQAALECLSLTEGEFATATNRLANARSYLQAGEEGAARFELRLLFHSLECGTSRVRE
jgi:hypothetical protein